MNPHIHNSNKDLSDFSLILGGPLYQLFRRSHLSGNGLELLPRRILVMILLAWVPLLILSTIEGHAWGGSVKLTFLGDIETQLRLLLALPLLIMAERFTHQRMQPILQQFMARGLVPDAAQEKFDMAIASALRLRNSVIAEVLLIAFVYGVGVLIIWRTQVALDIPSWHSIAKDDIFMPSKAGWWMIWVSMPLFQFLLLRWYYRLFIWARLLWQISRIKLNLMPTHPDRCGGLGFLAGTAEALAPLLLSQGVVLSGLIASRIFYEGATLPEFEMEIIGLVGIMIFVILGPLLAFGIQLSEVRRVGLREYGSLAQRYMREFDNKWLRNGAGSDEPLIGSADIQSLADLGNSYTVIREMQFVPITLRTVLQLALLTLLPVAPLLLTIIPLEEIFERVFKTIF